MRKAILISVIICCCVSSYAQQIPVGSCGIVYVHDASGNRTRRVYFCNNGSDPYPTIIQNLDQLKSQTFPAEFTKAELQNLQFQEVEALYPNPTSGIFYVSFSKPLNNAGVSILDAQGHVVRQFRASGYKLTCDLSNLASSTYFIQIKEKGIIISKKVIKE